MIHKCDRCAALENALYVALAERDEARQQAGTATDLMMKGEAMREKMMFNAVVGVDKARLLYILTGKEM